MNHKDVLIDLLQHFAFRLHRTIAGLSNEALQWQPDEEANNIAVTVWQPPALKPCRRCDDFLEENRRLLEIVGQTRVTSNE